MSDDKTCPSCGTAGKYWVYETEKECQVCGTTWFSAWQLGLNDPKEPEQEP